MKSNHKPQKADQASLVSFLPSQFAITVQTKKEKKRKEIKNEREKVRSHLHWYDADKENISLEGKRTKNEKMHFWWKKIWWVHIHFIIEMTLQSENRLTPLL